MDKTLDITAASWKTWKGQNQTLAVFAFQDEVPVLLGLAAGESAKKLQTVAKADGFKGKERETFLCRPAGANPAERVVLIGLGKKPDFNIETLRRAAATAVKRAESLDLQEIQLRAPQIARTPAGLQEEI